MLDANVKNQLTTYLQNLKRPVELVVSADERPKAKELLSLATDIAALSELVSLTESVGERTPSMTVTSPDTGSQDRKSVV